MIRPALLASIGFECHIDITDIGYLTGLESQVVSHEAVKMGSISFLREGHLHWVPVILIDPGLVGGLETHQNIVADQVSLAQLTAGRIHALEYELGIVLVAVQRDVDNHQFRETIAQGGQIATERFHAILKEGKVFSYPLRFRSGERLLLHQRQQTRFVGLRQDQLEATLTFFQRIQQIVAAQFLGGETVHRFGIAQMPCQSFEDQHNRGQALLPIDNQKWRLRHHLVKTLFDVDDGADKVRGHGTVRSCPQDIVPKLTAFLLCPAVGALVDRDNKLGRFLEEIQQLCFCSLHRSILTCSFSQQDSDLNR